MSENTNESTTTQEAAQAQEERIAVNQDLLLATIDAIRPSLQADGGDCDFVGVSDDGVVSLRLTGACQGCPMSSLTLSMGIERILKEHVPGVSRVEAVI